MSRPTVNRRIKRFKSTLADRHSPKQTDIFGDQTPADELEIATRCVEWSLFRKKLVKNMTELEELMESSKMDIPGILDTAPVINQNLNERIFAIPSK